MGVKVLVVITDDEEKTMLPIASAFGEDFLEAWRRLTSALSVKSYTPPEIQIALQEQFNKAATSQQQGGLFGGIFGASKT